MSESGELVKLKIIAYSSSDQKDGDKVGEFEAYYNPSSISSSYTVKYKEDERLTGSLHEMNFAGMDPSTFSFDLILDGTGASGKKIEVVDEVKKFLDLAYSYNGDEHKTNYLLISWGKAITLKCVLSSVSVNYDLFDPGGKPLRAKLGAQFKEYSYVDLTKAKENQSSPDMTHLRVVKQGDTLPQMCDKIYGDPTLWIEVARANGLTGFRRLKPGQKLFFPPLVNAKP